MQYQASFAAGNTSDFIVSGQAGTHPVGPAAVTSSRPGHLLPSKPDEIRVRPSLIVTTAVVTAVDGPNIHLASINMGNARGWLAAGAGAEVFFHTETGGVISQVSSGPIKKTRVATCNSPFVFSIDGGNIITGTEARFSPRGWYKPNANLYFWVAAIDANGDQGNWSAAGTWATSADPSYVAPSNTTASSPVVTGVLNEAIALPANVSVSSEDAGETAHITWDAVSGAVGYLVKVTDDNSPPLLGDDYITLVDLLPVQVGDMCTLRLAVDDTISKADVISFAYWDEPKTLSYYWPDHVADSEMFNGGDLHISWYEENGVPVVRYENNGLTNQNLTWYTHGGSDQDYYYQLEAGETYRHTLYARSPSNTVIAMEVRETDNPGPTNIPLSTTFAHHSVDFGLAAGAGPTGPDASFIIIPAGGVVEFTNSPTITTAWAVYDTRYPPHDLIPEEVEYLAHSDAYRTHQFIKRKPGSYDVDRLTDDNMLPRILRMVAAAEVNLWLQIEIHLMGEDDLEALAEYLCGENVDQVTTPWAFKRASQGQVAPWFDEFSKVYLELGNECWQPRSWTGFYDMPPMSDVSGGRTARSIAYARMINFFIDTLRAAASWNSTADIKIGWDGSRSENCIFGGWVNNNTGWNSDGAPYAIRAGFVTTGDYNGGWDTGAEAPVSASDPDDWAAACADTILTKNQWYDRFSATDDLYALATANGMKAGGYEEGPGFALEGTPEQIADERAVMQSAGSGAEAFASWLTRTARGVYLHNYFEFKYNNKWSSHTKPPEGLKMLPAYLWCVVFWNQHLKGGMISQDRVVRGAVTDLLWQTEVEPLTAWRVANGNSTYHILKNSDTNRSYTVTVLDGNLVGKQVTRHYLATPNAVSGDEYKTTNLSLETQNNISLSAEVLPSNFPVEITIPPGMVEVLQFG